MWAIRGAELSISPVHMAAHGGQGTGGRGLALRFPRFLSIRDDKTVRHICVFTHFNVRNTSRGRRCFYAGLCAGLRDSWNKGGTGARIEGMKLASASIHPMIFIIRIHSYRWKMPLGLSRSSPCSTSRPTGARVSNRAGARQMHLGGNLQRVAVCRRDLCLTAMMLSMTKRMRDASSGDFVG